MHCTAFWRHSRWLKSSRLTSIAATPKQTALRFKMTKPSANPTPNTLPPTAVNQAPSLKEIGGLMKLAGQAWLDDYAPSMGAALAYYTVFSLAPLLLIVISVAGLVFGPDAARGEIFGELRSLMGDDAAKAIEALLVSVSKPAQSVVATVMGSVALLIGATSVFGELQDALDRIWRAPARSADGGLFGLLRARLLSFGLILGLAFLLMVSLVFGALVAALGSWWEPLLSTWLGGRFVGWTVVAQSIDVVFSFVLTTLVFALIYKLMPRVAVHWSDVALGAVVTALLFTLGKTLIGVYIGKTGVASSFGAAGSLVIVLVWVYYSSQIFLMGAEFTWVYARSFGSMRNTAAAATFNAPSSSRQRPSQEVSGASKVGRR